MHDLPRDAELFIIPDSMNIAVCLAKLAMKKLKKPEGLKTPDWSYYNAFVSHNTAVNPLRKKYAGPRKIAVISIAMPKQTFACCSRSPVYAQAGPRTFPLLEPSEPQKAPKAPETDIVTPSVQKDKNAADAKIRV